MHETESVTCLHETRHSLAKPMNDEFHEDTAKPTSHSQQLFTYEIYYLYHISTQY